MENDNKDQYESNPLSEENFRTQSKYIQALPKTWQQASLHTQKLNSSSQYRNLSQTINKRILEDNQTKKLNLCIDKNVSKIKLIKLQKQQFQDS